MNPTAIYWSSFHRDGQNSSFVQRLLSHNLEFQPKVTSKPTTIHQHTTMKVIAASVSAVLLSSIPGALSAEVGSSMRFLHRRFDVVVC